VHVFLILGSTAAVFLPNRSSVKLAKVEGGTGYKTFMRRKDSLPPDNLGCRLLGTCPRKLDTDAATDMIATLKSSAEAFLGTRFCFADVVLPDRGKTYQKEVVEAALVAHDLRLSFPIQSAAKVAIIANDPDDSALPDEQIVLAIDYSRSGLNLDLFCDDIGIVDSLGRQHHELGIGADNPDPAHWAAVSAALQTMAQPPFPRCPMGYQDQDRIHYLVLYGERATDGNFLRTLVDVFGSDLVSRTRARDPEFVSALSAAEISFDRQNNIDFRGEPSFGCRWRSGLHKELPGDL